MAVDPANRPRFEDVEEAEHQEPCQQPLPALRHQPEGDPHADNLVPDNAFMVVYAQIIGNFAAQPEAKQHAHAEQQPVAPVGQQLPQGDERYGDQRAPGTRSLGQSAGTEAKGDEVPRVAPDRRRNELRRHLVGVIGHGVSLKC
ncbi:hypothetical protein D3C75_882630 [compost metagenome]